MSSRSKSHTWQYTRRQVFEETLRKASAEWFSARGYSVHPKMPYLLEHWDDWPKNIILPEVTAYIIEEKARRSTIKGFPLHKYLHHGLSSQAMLFNLIGSLIIHQDLSPLEIAFKQNNLSWPEGRLKADLEFEDRKIFNEDTGQPTSIDLVIRYESGKPGIFIEAKLSEKEFGGCSVFSAGDCDGRNPARNFSLCYLHHIGRKYWELLKKHGFLNGPIKNETICTLSVHYQFFREVIFALELEGTFVLLYDERNPTFLCKGPQGERGLMPLLLSFVPDVLHNRVTMISVQKVVGAIKSTNNHEWIQEFERKYGLEA